MTADSVPGLSAGFAWANSLTPATNRGTSRAAGVPIVAASLRTSSPASW